MDAFGVAAFKIWRQLGNHAGAGNLSRRHHSARHPFFQKTIEGRHDRLRIGALCSPLFRLALVSYEHL